MALQRLPLVHLGHPRLQPHNDVLAHKGGVPLGSQAEGSQRVGGPLRVAPVSSAGHAGPLQLRVRLRLPTGIHFLTHSTSSTCSHDRCSMQSKRQALSVPCCRASCIYVLLS